VPGGRYGLDDDGAGLRAQLRDVYWIGGGSGAGKSTVARRVAARYRLRLYLTDDVMSDHAERSDPEAVPFSGHERAMGESITGDERAVGLIPTPGFRRAAFSSRGSSWEIAGKTGDPARALDNLLERDRMFTDRLREEATGLGLRIIEVDTAMTEEGLTDRVAEAFGL
jgi:hypothetical protein